MIELTQIPSTYRSIIEDELNVYNEGRTVQVVNRLPDTSEIPIVKPRHWLKIPDVICVFVDMRGSTQLSATLHDQSTAGAYQLFTATAVKLFNAFGSPYIDVRGDGVFSLFNSDQVHRALAAAVTFKTFVKEVFKPALRERTKLEIGSHIGIDQKTVLVRKLGLKQVAGRSDRQNEVWAGKPVNMASKLAALGNDGDLLVSDRYHSNVTDDHALLSCGCVNGVPSSNRTQLWTMVGTNEISQKPIFDFPHAFRLRSGWCGIHGEEFCLALLKAEGDTVGHH